MMRKDLRISRRALLRSGAAAAAISAASTLLAACGGSASAPAPSTAASPKPSSAPPAGSPGSAAPSGSPAASAKPAASPASSVGAGGKEILFGAIYPLSGAAAPTGIDLKNGVDLAVEIVNNKHADLSALPFAAGEGLPDMGGAKLKVVYGDSQGDPSKGASETERLVSQEHVVCVIGCYQSNVTQTASQRAEQLQIPFLNPESTSPSLTEQGYKWFFRATPNDSTFDENFCQFLQQFNKTTPLPNNKLALFHENTLFGSDVAKYMKQFAPQYGLQISTDVAYAPNAADLTSEIQRLKADAAPVLIQASYVADATLSIKTYKQLGYLPKILIAQDAGFVDSTFIKNVGKDAQAMISREVWALDLGAKKPIVTSVNDLFKSQYKTNMNGNSARTFTGVFVIADAINRAKSTQPAAIQNALKTTDLKSSHLIMPWDGVKFDEKGQNTQGAGILIQIQDGEYKTVWPDSVASAKIIYPLPDWAK